VVVNFVDTEAEVALGPGHAVEVASDGAGEGGPFPGRLGPSQAMILRPAR
jgi:alpha-glucosidase